MPLPEVTPGLTSDVPIAPVGETEPAMDGSPGDLDLRVEGTREALPEEYREEYDAAINAAEERRTRQLQTRWTERNQKAAELERRFAGQDESLQLGQVFTTVKQQNPALAQRAYELLVSNTIGAGQGMAASQQPAGQVPAQTGSEVDPVEAKFRKILQDNPENPDAYRAMDAVASGRAGQVEQKLRTQLDQLTQAIQQGQVQQQIQTLHQQEADFLAKNPIFNQQKYIDEVRRRQQTERLPSGQPFITLPPDQQFMAVAQPDLVTAMARQRELDVTRPSRGAANVIVPPGHTSPNRPEPPKSEEDAWSEARMALGEMAMEDVEGDVY